MGKKHVKLTSDFLGVPSGGGIFSKGYDHRRCYLQWVICSNHVLSQVEMRCQAKRTLPQLIRS